MLVALTGANGFIGRAIARHLHAAGHGVRGLVRDPASIADLPPGLLDPVIGDQADPKRRRALTDGVDAVVHNAFDWAALREGPLDRHIRANIESALHLLADTAPRPFVFISSVAVHHEILDAWNGVIDAAHPTRPGSAYGAAKVAVEAHLFVERARGRAVCSLRPAAVYGMDPKVERTIGYPIAAGLAQTRRCDRQGGGKFVHVDDVAVAVTGALRLGAAAPPVVHLADCYARWGDLALWMAAAMGLDDAVIDLSSPATSRNQFTKEEARAVGVSLDRGHDGLRIHARAVAALVRPAMGTPDAPAPS